MADVIRKATNKFTKGLVMDFSPENTQNELLTHALNATLLTFNGNELSLQNDMGNARVETAYLPEGYMPVGTCEYGGIIYIVSYNPLEDKSQIGCFPSPERNISMEELGEPNQSLSNQDFQNAGNLVNNTKYVLLKNDKLNPGDKFLICSDDTIYDEKLDNLLCNAGDGKLHPVDHPILALNVVSIEDSGKIVYLNSDIHRYNITKNGKTYNYHILGEMVGSNQESIDIDSYRNSMSSGYSVFRSKTSGKLALLAELIMIDSYSVTHSIYPRKIVNEQGKQVAVEGVFDVVLHTDIVPEITESNYNIAPKLQYFYLKNSQGHLQLFDTNGAPKTVNLYSEVDGNLTNQINSEFLKTKLSTIYEPLTDNLDLDVELGQVGKFNFPKPFTYHGRMPEYVGTFSTFPLNDGYVKFSENKFHRIQFSQIASNLSYYYNELQANIYVYDSSRTDYIPLGKNEKINNRYVYYVSIVSDDYSENQENIIYREATAEDLATYKVNNIQLYYKQDYTYISEQQLASGNFSTLFISVPIDTYISCNKFIPNVESNYINGHSTSAGIYPKDDPISLHTIGNFIPDSTNNYEYSDLQLATINIPPVVFVSPLSDLPFKYDYTVIPCMNYGKLEHLAVSNTVDFSKLHAFNQSDFTMWKYHIDGNQLRLTFGADVYDTYETDKVDGLVLEFYDLWGFAGSLEITDKKAYSGVFTKIISLNTLNALSNKKVSENGYTSNFKRNINIQPSSNGYVYNNKPVSYINSEIGWSNISDNDNDCGTLYSNIVYGVKTYLRVSRDNDVKEFIPKTQFFLYTLPIYNDFYYTVNNFNNLANPQLEMMLTYKITDTSDRFIYEGGNIQNGYIESDNVNINTYQQGNYPESSLKATRYYKYAGVSDVYLEVGLKKEYSEVNVGYASDLNKYFSCELRLISNDDDTTTFTISSDTNTELSKDKLLQYNYSGMSHTSLNKLNFENDNSTIKITKDRFINTNFITSEGTQPIAIKYEFVVGYGIDISQIATTTVPVTTVCALLHKNDFDEYNYADFGIYAVDDDSKVDSDGNPQKHYYSNAMLYNGGTSEKEIFGVCRQINTSGSDMVNQCQIITSVQTDASPKKDPGLLNTGDPLQQIVAYIGKLTFCQPHAHGMSTTNGVNIHEQKQIDGSLATYGGIAPEEGPWTKYGSKDDLEAGYGITPRLWLHENPMYNLSLNTKKSILHQSEFISTVEYRKITNGRAWGCNVGGTNETHWVEDGFTMREYRGFTGEELEKFNTALLNTMAGVYAYNPDYDSMLVNAGEVTITDYRPKFTSNLLSSYASFAFEDNQTLNDFIYFGPIKFSDYLQGMYNYSEDFLGKRIQIYDSEQNPISKVTFVPNYTYCGLEDKYYLVSSLTYNTEAPASLESELSFRHGNALMIKHSDGSSEFMKGLVDKRTLYGYANKQLIQLDVSNYTIDAEGYLHMKPGIEKDSVNYSQSLSNSTVKSLFSNSGLSCNNQYINSDGVSDYLTAFIKLVGVDATYLTTDGSTVYFARRKNHSDNMRFKGDVIKVSNSKGHDYAYSGIINNLSVKCVGRILNGNWAISSYDRTADYYLTDLTIDGLKLLISDGYGNVTGTGVSFGHDHWKYTDPSYHTVYIDGIGNQENYPTVSINSYFNFNGIYSEYADLELYAFTFTNIEYTLKQLQKFPQTESIISTDLTEDYAKINSNGVYKVHDQYQQAQLQGTSITLNDLIYEPILDGHRLFMKKGLCKYDNSYRGKIYYRYYGSGSVDASWQYSNTKYLNNLFIYTGPCFTSFRTN